MAADPVDTREQATTRYVTPKEIIRRHAPLPRHYFQGHTIWGKEDGPVESAPDSILVKQVSDFWVNGRYQAIALINVPYPTIRAPNTLPGISR